MTESKEAGGVLVSGHNVVVLNVEILNKLLQNGWISKDEGQKAVDDSKTTWVDRPGLEFIDRPDLEWMDREERPNQ